MGGQPLLHHDSLLMDSEEATAATKTSTLCGHSIPLQLPVSTEAGTLMAAFEVWEFCFVFVVSDFKTSRKYILGKHYSEKCLFLGSHFNVLSVAEE